MLENNGVIDQLEQNQEAIIMMDQSYNFFENLNAIDMHIYQLVHNSFK